MESLKHTAPDAKGGKLRVLGRTLDGSQTHGARKTTRKQKHTQDLTPIRGRTPPPQQVSDWSGTVHR